jgi:tetratricopeptide (TPR) repeat protein
MEQYCDKLVVKVESLMKLRFALSIRGRARRAFILGAAGWLSCLLSVSGAAQAQGVDAEKLPMFGQPRIARPDNLKKADEGFIRDVILRFGNGQAGSNALAAQGWTALRSGQSDLAMLRFNQAWLVNPQNFRAFWGFGAVMSARGKLSEAVELLEKARELLDDPAQRVPLLCDLGTLHSEYAARLPRDRELERAQHFVLANSRFTESLENNPKYAMSWREWAISLYEQERYSEAWIKVMQARELRAEPFPPDFLKKLSTKMPEPK